MGGNGASVSLSVDYAMWNVSCSDRSLNYFVVSVFFLLTASLLVYILSPVGPRDGLTERQEPSR